MPRLVIKTKKKRQPTGELSRLKEQSRRLTEQLTSRDRELTEAAAIGTNLQIGNGCHCPERRGIARCSRTPWCSVDGKVKQRRCTLWIDPMRQVKEEDDEIDRALTLAAP